MHRSLEKQIPGLILHQSCPQPQRWKHRVIVGGWQKFMGWAESRTERRSGENVTAQILAEGWV